MRIGPFRGLDRPDRATRLREYGCYLQEKADKGLIDMELPFIDDEGDVACLAAHIGLYEVGLERDWGYMVQYLMGGKSASCYLIGRRAVIDLLMSEDSKELLSEIFRNHTALDRQWPFNSEAWDVAVDKVFFDLADAVEEGEIA